MEGGEEPREGEGGREGGSGASGREGAGDREGKGVICSPAGRVIKKVTYQRRQVAVATEGRREAHVEGHDAKLGLFRRRRHLSVRALRSRCFDTMTTSSLVFMSDESKNIR